MVNEVYQAGIRFVQNEKGDWVAPTKAKLEQSVREGLERAKLRKGLQKEYKTEAEVYAEDKKKKAKFKQHIEKQFRGQGVSRFSGGVNPFVSQSQSPFIPHSRIKIGSEREQMGLEPESPFMPNRQEESLIRRVGNPQNQGGVFSMGSSQVKKKKSIWD